MDGLQTFSVARVGELGRPVGILRRVSESMGDEDVICVGYQCLQNIIIVKMVLLVGVLAIIPAYCFRLVIVLFRSILRMLYISQFCKTFSMILPHLSRSMARKHSM
jgi:hypothetical protein